MLIQSKGGSTMPTIIAKRHEIKYVISQIEYIALVKKLDHILQRDDYCQKEGYTVTSLYFDDPHNSAYHQKLNGDSIRHKYRIRYYGDVMNALKLERKSKVHQMTHKISVPLTPSELDQLYAKDYNFLLLKNEVLYHEFYNQLTKALVKPKVIVSYRRIAYVHPIGDTRITLDDRIRTSSNQTDLNQPDLTLRDISPNKDVILEIKFNGVLPDIIKSMIHTGQMMSSASSKYVTSRKYNYEF